MWTANAASVFTSALALSSPGPALSPEARVRVRARSARPLLERSENRVQALQRAAVQSKADLQAVQKCHAAELAAERAKLWFAVTHPVRTYRASVDDQVRKSLSKWRFLPMAVRDRMARGAAKRRAAILDGPAGTPARQGRLVAGCSSM